ncbi:MAG: geranylgeranyl pyrophosphate synthase [Myxococcota bacterium]|jgi:geranylgeranyl pyrophosphate synthase
MQNLARSSSQSPPTLRSSAMLDEVERMMRRLSAGDRMERTGVMVQEHLATGGKRLRARLALCAMEALGGSRGDGVGWAAAVELLHNATLVHDDIQDGDRVRRGEPTTWVRYGIPQAINAGDLLLMLPFLAVGYAPEAQRWRLCQLLASGASDVVRGQVEELSMLSAESLSAEAWRRVVEGKTGGLFCLPVEGAALLAGHSPVESARIAAAFMPLGVLFQLQDDVLDLYGYKGREAPGADLCEGKISALVVAHLVRCPQDRPWLLELLRRPREQTGTADVEDAIARFRSSGALADVLDDILGQIQQVESAEILRLYPALRGVALQITALAMQPIAHLWQA